MAKKKHLGPVLPRTEEIIRQEALKIARATQSPGQSKEQTKLIAKGIANGIAEYKNRQGIKQRERNKLQNKRNTGLRQNIEPGPIAEPLSPGCDRLPGVTAAGIFLLAGILHLLRSVLDIEITIGTFSVPSSWSFAAGLAALVLAVWIYRATQAPIQTARLKNPNQKAARE